MVLASAMLNYLKIALAAYCRQRWQRWYWVR